MLIGPRRSRVISSFGEDTDRVDEVSISMRIQYTAGTIHGGRVGGPIPNPILRLHSVWRTWNTSPETWTGAESYTGNPGASRW